MKLVMLGSGTSMGVPRVGGGSAAGGPADWGDCDPDDPRNHRTRVSIVVETDAGTRLLVDTAPDLRAQLLANRIDRLDAVFWTHDHADHTHGIDDLRPLRYGRSAPLPGFAHAATARKLRQRFDYVFSGQYGYPTIVELHELGTMRLCAGVAIGWCQMPHGHVESTALRFEADGRSIGYATDFHAITDETVALFDGVDILVSDCLRREAHPTHAHLAMAIELIERCRARRGVLTHLDKSMDFRTVSREIPPHVEVGFDGLELAA